MMKPAHGFVVDVLGELGGATPGEMFRAGEGPLAQIREPRRIGRDRAQWFYQTIDA